jgi:DNA-binding NarL/FixJ family response regulator
VQYASGNGAVVGRSSSSVKALVAAISGALKAGALGYPLESGLGTELLEAIRTVKGGRRYLPLEVAADLGRHAADDALTSREVEVLRRVAAGQSNKRISRSYKKPLDVQERKAGCCSFET